MCVHAHLPICWSAHYNLTWMYVRGYGFLPLNSSIMQLKPRLHFAFMVSTHGPARHSSLCCCACKDCLRYCRRGLPTSHRTTCRFACIPSCLAPIRKFVGTFAGELKQALIGREAQAANPATDRPTAFAISYLILAEVLERGDSRAAA